MKQDQENLIGTMAQATGQEGDPKKVQPAPNGMRLIKPSSAIEYHRESSLPDDLVGGYTKRSLKPMKLMNGEPYARLPNLNFVYFGHDSETGLPDVGDCFGFAKFSCDYGHDDLPLTAHLTFEVKDVIRGLEQVVEQDVGSVERLDGLQEAWFPAKFMQSASYGGDILQFSGLNLPVWGRFAEDIYHANGLLHDPIFYGDFDINSHYSVRLSYYIEDVLWGWSY